MNSRTSSKTGKIRSLIIELHPLIAEKASVWHCHQHNSFSFGQFFLKSADKVDRDEFSDKFKTLARWDH